MKEDYTDCMNWFARKHPAPPMYGSVHLTFLFLIVIAVWTACYIFREKNRKQVIRILFLTGVILALMEILKQIFLYRINGYFDWWRFPFQICSMPMYLCLLLPFLKGTKQNTVLCYLDSFCLQGAFFALIFPQDMLSAWPFLTIHSFVWHGLLVFISFLIITHHMEGRSSDFFHAVMLFLMLAGCAEIINIIGARIATHALPDMFYISPYTQTLQPFFRNIETLSGRKTEIIVYLLFYIAGCAGIHFLTASLHKEKNTR